MKRIIRFVLMLCVLLMAAGCENNTDKADESSSAPTSQITSSSIVEETSTAEATTEQTVEPTTEEVETEITPSETDSKILKLNRKSLYDYEWSEEYGVNLAEFECSSVLLENEDASLYPELAKALSDAADFYEVNMLEEYDLLTEDAKEMFSSEAESFSPLVSTLDVHIRHADNTVLSVLYDSYYYNGMNDGSRSFWGGNYDTKTGKELHLPDVVTDIDEFAKVVETELFDAVGSDVFYSDTIIEDYFSEYGADGNHWTMEYNGITVYFDEGEIANPGFGVINLTIEFEKYPELFSNKYTVTPEAYIVGLPMKSTFFSDLNGDGDCDELVLSDRYEGEFGLNRTLTLYISTAEIDYTESLMANGCECYYVKTADGKSYLYVLIELESQSELHTYEITNTIIKKVGEQPISPYYNNEVSSVLTDPDNMHFDIFGKDAGISVGDDFFLVGADGMPVQG